SSDLTPNWEIRARTRRRRIGQRPAAPARSAAGPSTKNSQGIERMRLLNRSSWCAAGLAAGWLAVHAAAADETAEVAEAILENPDCVGATLANEAINEGLRRGGRRLLSRLGVNAPQRAAAVPCGDAQAAAEPADAPAAVQTPAPAQPAAAQAASAASRTAAASTASTAAAEPEQRSGPFARLRQAATNPNANANTNQRGR